MTQEHGRETASIYQQRGAFEVGCQSLLVNCDGNAQLGPRLPPNVSAAMKPPRVSPWIPARPARICSVLTVGPQVPLVADCSSMRTAANMTVVAYP